jgi:hypothetical protein
LCGNCAWRVKARNCPANIKQNVGNLYASTLAAHLIVHFGQGIVDLPVLRKLFKIT